MSVVFPPPPCAAIAWNNAAVALLSQPGGGGRWEEDAMGILDVAWKSLSLSQQPLDMPTQSSIVSYPAPHPSAATTTTTTSAGEEYCYQASSARRSPPSAAAAAAAASENVMPCDDKAFAPRTSSSFPVPTWIPESSPATPTTRTTVGTGPAAVTAAAAAPPPMMMTTTTVATNAASLTADRLATLSATLRSTVTRATRGVQSVGLSSWSSSLSSESETGRGTEQHPTRMVGMANGLDLLVSPTNYFCVYDRAFVVVTATPSGDEGRPWNHNNNNIIPNDDEEGSSSSCSSSILHAQNEEDRRTMQWLRSVPHIPAVILFNAGLVKHRQAILLCSTTTPKTSTTSSTSSTALFHEGLTLYKMAQHCLDCNAQSGYYVAELDVLSLALANNMGHVYSHFHEWDLVKACLEKMVLLFLFANTTFLLAGEEYEFFHTTIYWAFVAILTLRGQHNNNGWMDGWMDRNLNGNTCRRLLTTLDLTYCL